jgi:hypothetical protein
MMMKFGFLAFVFTFSVGVSVRASAFAPVANTKSILTTESSSTTTVHQRFVAASKYVAVLSEDPSHSENLLFKSCVTHIHSFFLIRSLWNDYSVTVLQGTPTGNGKSTGCDGWCEKTSRGGSTKTTKCDIGNPTSGYLLRAMVPIQYCV